MSEERQKEGSNSMSDNQGHRNNDKVEEVSGSDDNWEIKPGK